MAKNTSVTEDALETLRSRLDWLDEERRKGAKRITELEQRISQHERDINSRDRRIKDLEEKLAKTTGQLARHGHVDTQLEHFRDEMVKLIERYDQRQNEAIKEQEKLRRMEHEMHQRELGDLNRSVSSLGQIRTDIEMRQAEDTRLAGLISTLQHRVNGLDNQVGTWDQELQFVEESARANGRTIADLELRVLETGKRLEPLETRLEVAGHSLLKAQTTVTELDTAVKDLQQSIAAWTEKVQVGEYERNRRLDGWRQELDGHEQQRERWAAEWVKIADQYKEARMALESMAAWQKQMEQQQREASELARVESNRLRSLWQDFTQDFEKRWGNLQVDLDQRWGAADRNFSGLQRQIAAMEEQLAKLEQEIGALWRVQTAQTDTIKRLPQAWLEAVEKAIAHDPNSRRQPALVPVREE